MKWFLGPFYHWSRFLAALEQEVSMFYSSTNGAGAGCQFCKPSASKYKAGLNSKAFIQTVEYYDNRLLDFDAESRKWSSPPTERLTSDAFVRYHHRPTALQADGAR